MRFETPDPSRLRWKVFLFHIEFRLETPWGEVSKGRWIHTWSGILHGRLKKGIRGQTCKALKCVDRCILGPEGCLYARLFQPGQIRVNGKVNEAPPSLILRCLTSPENGAAFQVGEVAKFEIVLIGPAIDSIGAIVQVLTEMSDCGPGWTPTFRVLMMVPGIPPELDRSWLELADFEDADAPPVVRVNLTTPWIGPKIVPNFADLWHAMNRRVYGFLRAAYAPSLALAPDLRPQLGSIETVSHDIEAGPEWSYHATNTLQLNGYQGSVTVAGDLRPFWPLLSATEFLHVGSKTGVGLGKVALEELD